MFEDYALLKTGELVLRIAGPRRTSVCSDRGWIARAIAYVITSAGKHL